MPILQGAGAPIARQLCGPEESVGSAGTGSSRHIIRCPHGTGLGRMSAVCESLERSGGKPASKPLVRSRPPGRVISTGTGGAWRSRRLLTLYLLERDGIVVTCGQVSLRIEAQCRLDQPRFQ